MINLHSKRIKEVLTINDVEYTVKVSVFRSVFSAGQQATIFVEESDGRELFNIKIIQQDLPTVHALLSSVCTLFRQASGLPMPAIGALPSPGPVDGLLDDLLEL